MLATIGQDHQSVRRSPTEARLHQQQVVPDLQHVRVIQPPRPRLLLDRDHRTVGELDQVVRWWSALPWFCYAIGETRASRASL
jgi:hypothetical protein